MRIISGKWRSRKIDWPTTGVTRPITDRVREAVFDVLGAHFGTLGALPPLRVADVFAGGGSLGLEALSRGADRVCFFERDRAALAVLKRNLDRLEAGPEAVIVSADLWRGGLRPPPSHRPLQLLFVDPPFFDCRDLSDGTRMAELLRRLGSSDAVSADARVVLRQEEHVGVPSLIGKHWVPMDRRIYGRSAVVLLGLTPGEPEP